MSDSDNEQGITMKPLDGDDTNQTNIIHQDSLLDDNKDFVLFSPSKEM